MSYFDRVSRCRGQTHHWEHQVHAAELLQIAEPLELWRVDDLDAGIMQFDMSMDSVIEDLVAVHRAYDVCSLGTWSRNHYWFTL